MPTNRYLLFCGDGYYPDGGARDLVATFEHPGDAITAGAKILDSADMRRGWCQVFDLWTMSIVWSDGGHLGDEQDRLAESRFLAEHGFTMRPSTVGLENET